MKLSEDVDL